MWRKRIEPQQQRERVIKDIDKARERTMNRAVKLLAAKPRSMGELRERLLEKMWTNDAIVDGVLAKLLEYGYLDDEKFATDLAASKLRGKPQGKRRLLQSMSRKKLDRETLEHAVEVAFEKTPESDLIDAAIEKRARLKGTPQTREDLKRFQDHLLRLGFGYDLIREKMSGIRTEI
jgi:regulatory protein